MKMSESRIMDFFGTCPLPDKIVYKCYDSLYERLERGVDKEKLVETYQVEALKIFLLGFTYGITTANRQLDFEKLFK